jgi:hypothetical protein
MTRRFLFWAAVIAVVHTVPTAASAASITYTVNCDVGSFTGGDPLGLAGAGLTLVYQIDTTALTPAFNGTVTQADQATAWPNSNTTAWLTILGSTSGDGTYGGTISGGSSFVFFDDANAFSGVDGMDNVQFPSVQFSVMGETLDTAGLNVAQDDSFNTPSGPIHAYPFSASDVTRVQDAFLIYLGGVAEGSNTSASNTTASAIPEPSTGLLLAVGLCLISGRRAARPRSAQAAPSSSNRSA